jgi:hypothetical protein
MARRPAPQSKITRGAPRREPRKRLPVVCGAKETEPGYVNGLKRYLRNAAVSVDLLTKDKSPSQVVRYGIKKSQQSADAYDELWCIVDVDQFSDIDEAVKLAANATTRLLAVTVVVSNPCFELWLLLHFAEQRGHLAGFEQLKPLLRKHVPDYNKCGLDFSIYATRYLDAAGRARALDPSGEDHRLNPSTNMWRLVDAMCG